MAMLRTVCRVSLAGCLVLGAAAASGGCAILGAVAYKVSGPTTHAPEYLLADEPTIVIVERAGNPGETAVEALQIAAVMTDLLKATKTVKPATQPARPMPTFIDPGLALEARGKLTPDGRRPTPAEVARTCGAKQVIYVDLRYYSSTRSLAGDAIDGNAEAGVWVFDARTAQARWPLESTSGKSVAASVPFTPVTGTDTGETVRQKLAQDFGTKVARLFTGWTEE
ncbi:MAG TPA: hypothetical protein VF796_08585 [Humisphaera sp.]